MRQSASPRKFLSMSYCGSAESTKTHCPPLLHSRGDSSRRRDESLRPPSKSSRKPTGKGMSRVWSRSRCLWRQVRLNGLAAFLPVGKFQATLRSALVPKKLVEMVHPLRDGRLLSQACHGRHPAVGETAAAKRNYRRWTPRERKGERFFDFSAALRLFSLFQVSWPNLKDFQRFGVNRGCDINGGFGTWH